jgi:hypothetical protein
MDAFEITSLVILNITILILFLRKKTNTISFIFPILTLSVFALHFIFEKSRWQMFPGYSLLSLIVVCSVIRFIKRRDEKKYLKLMNLIVAGLGLSTFLLPLARRKGDTNYK